MRARSWKQLNAIRRIVRISADNVRRVMVNVTIRAHPDARLYAQALVAALLISSPNIACGGTSSGGDGGAPVSKTRVIVLGVDHSVQLVSSANQPGLLTSFIERLRPDAICIERPPELTERGDFYEFTYEVQSIIMPYRSSHPIDLCPVDWMPPVEDQKLVWGADLDVPPEIRPERSFLTFPEPASLMSDFFIGEDRKVTDPIETRMSKPNMRADQDFPRRLFLYRTFMQSQHIRAAAKAHAGGTILVVIGYFHKAGIEAILASDPTIDIVQPSSLGRPTSEAAEDATTPVQRVAILSFNLLGRQAATGNIDWSWIERVLASLDKTDPSPETTLFHIRHDELRHQISSKEASVRYSKLAETASADQRFAWTGVKDETRLDSYFDPFGNLAVRERAFLELARTQREQGSDAQAMVTLGRLRAELPLREARQLDAYWEEYVIAPSGLEGIQH